MTRSETVTEAAAESELLRDTEEQFTALDKSFGQAMEAAPDELVERWFTMAGRATRFRVVGRELAARMLRPFLHLQRQPASEIALSVDLWDESATGVHNPYCHVREDLAFLGAFGASEDGRFIMHELAQTKSVLDRVQRRLLGWAGTHERLTLYELGRPLHSQLLLWHKDRDMQAAHSGLVARNGHGVLFGGPGGSGKSTVSLTCHKAGWDFLGDDYIGVQHLEDGGFIGHSVYSSTHVDPEHLKRFPDLLPHAVYGTLAVEDKAAVMLAEARAERLTASARIRAVALPRVAHKPKTTVRKATAAEALLQLAPSSLVMLPHAGMNQREFARMAKLVQSLPAFRVELGYDMESIPDHIGWILDQALQFSAVGSESDG